MKLLSASPNAAAGVQRGQNFTSLYIWKRNGRCEILHLLIKVAAKHIIVGGVSIEMAKK
jgi:hypothetical protein